MTSQDNVLPSGENSVSLTRLPVFDEQNRLWGYELFCVGGIKTAPPSPGDEECVALCVANSACMGLQHILKRGEKIFLNFNEKGILADMPYAFPPDAAVVKIHERLFFNADIAPALDRLKTDGFMISVTDFSGSPDHDPVYRRADIFSIVVEGRRKDQLSALMGTAGRYDVKLLAASVADHAMFDRCRQMGFSFQQAVDWAVDLTGSQTGG